MASPPAEAGHEAKASSPTPVTLPTTAWGNRASQYRVLAVHGLTASANSWWYVADRLARTGVYVVAPDLRGHGNAPRTMSYRIDEHAADLVALGKDWDVVVGHSLAGPIVASAAREPRFARSLLLLDPVFEIADADLDAVVADQLRELDPRATAETVLQANPSWHPEDAFQKAAAARQTSPFVVERCLRDNQPWSHLGLLGPEGLPATAILGADPAVGTMFPPRLMGDGRVGSKVSYEQVEGVGHGIHRAAGDRVVAAVQSLLGQLHRDPQSGAHPS